MSRYTHTPYSLIYSTHNGDDARQNTYFKFNNFFSPKETFHLRDNVGKYGRAR